MLGTLLTVQVNYFKDKADTAISESNSAFQVTVNGAPKPSDACVPEHAPGHPSFSCSLWHDMLRLYTESHHQ